MAARTGPTCGAQRRNNMGPCGQPAGWHTDHPGYGRCSWHGGASRQSTKAAARQRAEAEAREILARLDVPPVTNPLRALRKLAGQAEAWKETCAGLVNRIGSDELLYVGRAGSGVFEQQRAEVAMYQDSMRQSASLLISLVKFDVDRQLWAMEEHQIDVLAAALFSAIAKAGLSPEQKRLQHYAARLAYGRRLACCSAMEAQRTLPGS